jgi:hypothetical protein
MIFFKHPCIRAADIRVLVHIGKNIKVKKNWVMVFITLHGITQAKMNLSHKACITQVF